MKVNLYINKHYATRVVVIIEIIGVHILPTVITTHFLSPHLGANFTSKIEK